MSQIHREGLIFKWITKDHEITVGFKRVGHGKCSICGARIPRGNTICDKCFEQEKNVSKK
jgi:predicted amidophosphoribosyltransferase